MIVLDKDTKKILIDTFKTKNIGLEGNITKLIDAQDDEEFKEYLKTCIEKDGLNRRKRLEITKQVQIQNKDLTTLNEENQRMMEELQNTLTSMEDQNNQIESQNSELLEWKLENEKIGSELVEAMKQSEQARITAENAKNEAENNLDLIQKKTQFELIKNARIPANDALNPIVGSLVLEVGDRIEIQGLSNNTMKFTLSILESAK